MKKDATEAILTNHRKEYMEQQMSHYVYRARGSSHRLHRCCVWWSTRGKKGNVLAYCFDCEERFIAVGRAFRKLSNLFEKKREGD